VQNDVYEAVIVYMATKFSQTFGEEHKLRVSESRVLRRKFGPKSDEIIGSWKEESN
jgi:hypothetical protein